jgi:hypothetical protein
VPDSRLAAANERRSTLMEKQKAYPRSSAFIGGQYLSPRVFQQLERERSFTSSPLFD